jgi:hypothetical protein
VLVLCSVVFVDRFLEWSEVWDGLGWSCLGLSSQVWGGLVCSGVGWSGLVWGGMVWGGMMWSGVVWGCLVWSCLVCSGLVWSGLGNQIKTKSSEARFANTKKGYTLLIRLTSWVGFGLNGFLIVVWDGL